MGRLDWLLRMPAEVERAEERDFGQASVSAICAMPSSSA